MLGIYDKGKRDSTFIQNVRKHAELGTKVCKNLHELHDCEIVVAHIFDKEWGSLIKDYSCPNSVRIRVSTVGFPDAPSPTISTNNVYTFHLVPSTDRLGETQWKEMLCGLSDKATVASLVRGDSLGRLRRFFVHEVQEYLSALDILCEGYLAVHAETDHKDISPALELMNWTEFINSAKGRELIRRNLGDKMDAVRQPEWWLRVFERESFYDNVKKEWEAAVGGEIPDALDHLLEVVRDGKAVEPPTIVVDAYCVLAKRMRTAPSNWQTRRNKFNHDWLKNKFLNSFSDFIEQLKKRDPDLVRLSEFLAADFPAWESHRREAQRIVQSFEDSMSPRRFFNYSPLNRCDDETQEWLGDLVHELGLSRYPVKSKAKESREALVEVNELYEKIAYESAQSNPIELTKLTALYPQFCELKETYETFSNTLSNLPRYASHGG